MAVPLTTAPLSATTPGDDTRPVLGLDADDTLWENEERFHEVEARFRDLVAPWADGEAADAALLATERANITRHGYGIKGFVLSMTLTAIDLSDGTVNAGDLGRIIAWGHEMMAHPIELLDGVAETLEVLADTHRLLVVTKGDLGDQLGKVDRCGLDHLFWDVDVVPEKDPDEVAAVEFPVLDSLRDLPAFLARPGLS